MNKIQKCLRVLIGFKVFVIIAGSFIPYIGTHVFRQNDTLGVTMRYWMRWFHEDVLYHAHLPAILNAGDNYGIVPMEFPLLNFLTAPGFILGLDYGRFGVMFIHSLLLIGLLTWNHRIWKDKKILGVEVGVTTWLYIVFGVAHIYFTKYMPDSMAILLMTLACGYSWERSNFKRSLPLAALALLMKPPVVFLFGLFLLKDFKTQVKNTLTWAIPATVICLIYYKVALPMIAEISDVKNVFAFGLRSPIQSLSEFFTHPADVFSLFIKNFFTKYLFFVLLIDLIWRLITKRPYPLLKLWGIFLIQVLASAALIGHAGFVHEYYYISTTFIACLLFKEFLQNSNKYLIVLSLVVLSGYTLERSIYTLRPPIRGHLWYECRELNEAIPDSVLKIQTDQRSANPIEGVCMSKVQNSEESDWAVYLHDAEQPGREEFELVDKTEHLRLYKKRH